MVVAQLVERSIPTPEIHGSNPVIGKMYMYLLPTVDIEKDEKKKEAVNGSLKIVYDIDSWTSR